MHGRLFGSAFGRQDAAPTGPWEPGQTHRPGLAIRVSGALAAAGCGTLVLPQIALLSRSGRQWAWVITVSK